MIATYTAPTETFDIFDLIPTVKDPVAVSVDLVFCQGGVIDAVFTCPFGCTKGRGRGQAAPAGPGRVHDRDRGDRPMIDFSQEEARTRDVFGGVVSYRMLGISPWDVKYRVSDWALIDLALSSPLIATQGTLSTEIVAAFVDDRHRRPRGIMRDPDPILVRIDGRVYVIDGHHRITAAKVRGDATLRCWIGTLTAGRSPP